MDAPFCPICLSDIEGVSNKVTTECGHSFHCSCLMHNALVNGFSCPCCRTVMAQRTYASPIAATNSITPNPLPLPEAEESSWMSAFLTSLPSEEARFIAFLTTLPPVPAPAPQPNPERVRVRRATIGGKSVFMTNSNMVYNPETKEEIGMWDNGTGRLAQYDDSLDLWLTVWTSDSGMPFPMENIF